VELLDAHAAQLQLVVRLVRTSENNKSECLIANTTQVMIEQKRACEK
jgi:hypothetical protein